MTILFNEAWRDVQLIFSFFTKQFALCLWIQSAFNPFGKNSYPFVAIWIFFYILGRFCWIAVYTYIKIILPYVGKLKLFQRFNAGVIVTSEKLSLLLLLPAMKYPPQSRHRRCIIIGNNDIGDILSALSVTKVVCPRIFLIIQNVPNGILRVLGETRSKKSRVRLPLKPAGHP